MKTRILGCLFAGILAFLGIFPVGISASAYATTTQETSMVTDATSQASETEDDDNNVLSVVAIFTVVTVVTAVTVFVLRRRKWKKNHPPQA